MQARAPRGSQQLPATMFGSMDVYRGIEHAGHSLSGAARGWNHALRLYKPLLIAIPVMSCNTSKLAMDGRSSWHKQRDETVRAEVRAEARKEGRPP